MTTTTTTTTQTIKFLGDNQSITLRKLCAAGDSNTKLRKSSGAQFVTLGQSMSPERLAWKVYAQNESEIEVTLATDKQFRETIGSFRAVNSCPMASAGCAGACLDHQGLGSVFKRIGLARKARTIVFNECRQWYVDKLHNEIDRANYNAQRKGLRLAVRLNVFSDIPWESYVDMGSFPNVEFYDYTAIPRRAGALRSNYWVTLSRKENNENACVEALRSGRNVAVCFADSGRAYCGNKSGLQRLPRRWKGFEVIDGDTTDLRFDDVRGRKHGRVIGLRLKAHSRAERQSAIDSGFAVVWN